MPLIKHNLAPTTTSPFSLHDIEEQASALVRRARLAAEQSLVTARREAGALRSQAVADGRDEGYRAGLERGMAEGRAEGLERAKTEGYAAGREAAMAEVGPPLSAAHAALVAALERFDADRRDLSQSATAEVVQLALAVAAKVTKRQAAIEPAVLTANLADAVRLAVRAADLRVVVHPDQRATIERELPKLKLDWPALEHVEVVDDATIAPGGCRLLTRGGGEVDARIDTQLERLVAELMPQEQRG